MLQSAYPSLYYPSPICLRTPDTAIQPKTSHMLAFTTTTMFKTTTTDTNVRSTAKPPTMLLVGEAARPQSKDQSTSRNMLPEINVMLANEFVEETLTAISVPLQNRFLGPPAVYNYPSPTVSSYTLNPNQRTGSITPPSVPVLRVDNSRPASYSRTSRNAAGKRPAHRRVVSLPADMMGPLRPLTDGPMGYTYTPTATRFSERLESFIPPEHYARRKASNVSLVVSICEPAEKQVILCTPGAAHPMGIEKKKGFVMKGVKKVWRFLKKKSRSQTRKIAQE
jgi:hypothetical protein